MCSHDGSSGHSYENCYQQMEKSEKFENERHRQCSFNNISGHSKMGLTSRKVAVNAGKVLLLAVKIVKNVKKIVVDSTTAVCNNNSCCCNGKI